MPETMRRWSVDDYGRANLQLRCVPVPTPAQREVLVKVAAVSLNHRDLAMIADGMGGPLDFRSHPDRTCAVRSRLSATASPAFALATG